MPDTTSASLQLVDQTTGGNENTWGDIADLNFAKVEQAIAMTSIIAVSGGSVTPDSDTIRKALLIFTGTLASNQTVIVANAQKLWTVKNTTTGNFTLTIKTAAGASVIVPRGPSTLIYCDGADVNVIRPEKTPFAVATGTADAITAAFSPAITAEFLVDGLILAVRAAFANATTTPSFTPDGIGTGTVNKLNNQALAIGDIAGAGHICLFSYTSATTSWQLLDPIASVTLNGNNAFTGNETHAGTETFNGKVQLNAGVAVKEQALTWVSTPSNLAFDPASGTDAIVTLLGAASNLNPPVNQSSYVGMHFQLRVIQDATGGRANTFDAVYASPDGSPLWVNPAANSETKYNGWIKAGSGAASVVLTLVPNNSAPVLLNTLTASASASLSDTTSFTSAFRYYRIIFEGVIPVTNGVSLLAKPQVSGTFQNATSIMYEQNAAGASGYAGGSGEISSPSRVSNAASYGYNGEMLVENPAGTTLFKMSTFRSAFIVAGTTNPATSHGTHVYAGSTAAVTGFQFSFSSGNIASGTIKIYGWN